MPPQNSGLIPGFRPSDFAGGDIPYQVRNPSGNWLPYQVRGEKQWYNVFDSMACVSFSANNSCEIQVKQQTGVEVNFSDRYLAKRSGTMTNGNWLYKVGDVLEQEGCVLESEWPIPPEPLVWDKFYETIPQTVVSKSKSFRDKYEVKYQRLGLIGIDITPAALQYHLRHAPLWVTIPGHAITALMLEANNATFTYIDSYDPYIKTRPITDIDSVWKIVLTVKKGNDPMIIVNNTTDPNTKFTLADDQLVGFADLRAYQNYTAGRTIVNLTLTDLEFNKIPRSLAVIKT